eukprot:TRINITY_DN6762_c0_g1_i1.p1 TRINITY_DN6762_c0_g1~~TRINITY_DN6762_c0_g1_i1.p1  ORF type:complete len:390 (+),score=96.68 TRINITY_DN6762_c0_g1_i1:84-1253(+)
MCIRDSRNNNSFNPAWTHLRRGFCSAELALSRTTEIIQPSAPVQIQGRKGLPDNHNVGLPTHLNGPNDTFPCQLKLDTPADEEVDVWELADLCREHLDNNLSDHGAILLQKLPLDGVSDFSEFVRALGWRTSSTGDYLRNMQGRSMSSTPLTDLVRTSSDEPPAYTIEPHPEYHTAGFPSKIMLFCQNPPKDGMGGEWPVTDTRQVYKDLDQDVKDKFEALGVRYSVFYESSEKNPRYTTWQANLAPTKEGVEEYLKALGYTWEWGADDSLVYQQNFDATWSHPKTGEPCWFNQAHAQHWTFYQSHPIFWDKTPEEMAGRWPVDCSYGDGSEIPQEVLNHLRETIWANTIALPMRQGDLLVCDNFLAMHGRMSFEPGAGREVYVSAIYD